MGYGRIDENRRFDDVDWGDISIDGGELKSIKDIDIGDRKGKEEERKEKQEVRKERQQYFEEWEKI